MRSSLRWRLSALATLVVLAGLAAGALGLTALLAGSRVDALGELAAARADTVAELVRRDQLPDVLPTVEPGEVVQVLDADDGVLATSANASRSLPLLTADQRSELDDGVLAGTAYGLDPVRVEVRAAELDGAPVTVVAAVPLRDVLSAIGALRTALLVVVPLVSLAVGGLSFLLLGRALAPVDDLRAAAARVTALGGRGTLPVPTSTELATLARTLNAMLERLHAAGERQTSFVADAAHELRSPLAGVRATVEVALAHPGSYDVGGLAQDVHAEVLRLQLLVDDLLVLASVGARPSRRTDVDLVALATGLTADDPRVRVLGAGRVVTDGETVRRVLRNLLDNARRHAATSVVVEVDGPRVQVVDDGPGVAEADRERVFDRFTRLDDARGRSAAGPGGTGLGLAIARESARALGGDVLLAASDGGGACFALLLPAAAPDSPAPLSPTPA